jgi:hypothetical protein
LRRLLLIFLLLLSYGFVKSQSLSASVLVEASAVSKQKFESYITKRGFSFVGTTYQSDTIARDYVTGGKSKGADSIKRALTSFSTKEDFSFTYHTASVDEYRSIKNELKKTGFFCNHESDSSLPNHTLLFQSKDITVAISYEQLDTVTDYSFRVKKQMLPKAKDISYAEDLIAFNSHEYLRFYFGDDNVKKDIYYLSDTKIGKCSVLFPNTNRQIVFLWGDEVNNCNLTKMYIGGQLMAESNLDYDKNVAENLWRLKSGIHAGMSLYALRQMNDAAFNFNGGKSPNTGQVFPDSTGKVDFRTDGIILGCMNCNDPKFLRQAVCNSDEAIGEERILFVHTIILDAAKVAAALKPSAKE